MVERIISMFSLVFAASISMAQDVVPYTFTTEVTPKINVESEAYLGERLLSVQNGEWRECITPKETHTGTYSGSRVRYRAGEKMCKGNSADKFYHPDYVNYTFGADSMPVRWKKKGNKSSLCACYRGCGWCVKKLPESAVKEGLEYFESNDVPSQSIELIGLNKKILTFAYVETSRDEASKTYREFKLDLEDGNLTGFKGAVIEILSATAMSVTYKVKRNFSS